MESFTIRIRLKSSLITPFHSDTLWGHICWALRYVYNEDALGKFLKSYGTGEPPLIISNAFPKGFLPYPVLPPIKTETAMAIAEEFFGKEDLFLGTNILKRLVNARYLSMEILKNLAESEISNKLLLKTILKDPSICPKIADYLPNPCQNKRFDKENKRICGFYSNSEVNCPSDYRAQIETRRQEQTVTYHAKIDRLLGATKEGSLFTTQESFWGGEEFEAYCKVGNNFTKEKLANCLGFITMNGYGKKKSTGKGSIECVLENDNTENSPKGANAFMTLSNYVPKANDPRLGYYRLFTKYGKLGGHFASSPITSGGDAMPFKYPLIMFEPGSVFKLKEGFADYGRVVNGMHAVNRPEICHYGIAYPFFLKVKWDGESGGMEA